MKKEEVTIKDAPFYYVDGKGWKIRQHYTDVNYGRIQIEKQWFRTKKEAKANYESVKIAAIEKAKKKLEKVKFPNKVSTWRQFKEAFIEQRITEIRGNTWKSKDEPMMNKYFNPHFNGLSVDECFTANMARRLKNAILSAKTKFGDDVPLVDKNRAITLYLKMLEFGFENDYITDSVEYRHCKAVMKKIRVADETGCGHKRPPIALTVEQVNRLLSVIDYGSMDYVVTKLMFVSGLRIGELLALYPEDLDLDNGKIKMTHIIAPDKDGDNKRFARAKTKNGLRDVPIADDITKLLHFYIKSNGIKKGGFLFPGVKDGKPMDRTAYARRLRDYCKEAGVPQVSPHAARHTFSTIAHELGFPSEVIAMILGHTVIVDVNVYNHLANEEKARNMINSMFSSKVGSA